ncbi:histone deacetylase [Psychrobium sp. 1_MG-2023]|uniref:histone deacetylase family protein n=1 Tax=Psychrobium sp. 1_MG-2023 TaxID=3062624 RepID=UPI000C31DD97|nr:histone deacetylase [Psychrobium sp. 1_MG-2023]MDP2559948.1 histone deacetylase [Psychrobium sp. 1_MG-2023]PKF56384.1 histone deacetylase [Alteromonadales bacterium alter-6D02]
MNYPVIYHPIYSSLALGPKHRFPIKKYQLLEQLLRQDQLVAPTQWVTPQAVAPDKLSPLHCRDYINRVVSGALTPKEVRRLGFPWSPQLVARSLTSVGGTLLGCELALEQGLALHLSGGYHHAHFDFASGYCLFNDLAFAAVEAIEKYNLSTVLIFDCDVHQGDGTAALTSHRDDVITCSLHCAKNFPANKMVSTIDHEFEPNTQDAEYLTVCQSMLNYCINLYQPDLIIYDAGVDIHQQDVLGLLDVTTQGLYQRDRLVIETAQQAEIPLCCVTGGGYHKDQTKLIPLHSQLFRAAKDLHKEPST